jgi:uncharacterized protein (DUF433 family)
MAEDLLSRVTVDPEVMVGKPVIRGTRITVEHILRELASGMSVEEMTREYPGLTADDVRAAQLYAAEQLGRRKRTARKDAH